MSICIHKPHAALLTAILLTPLSAASQLPLNLDFIESASTIRPGLAYIHLSSPKTETHAPLSVHILEADLEMIGIGNALALDQILGKERTTSIAVRHGAIAAINGGFFTMTGNYQGDPAGFLVIEGAVLSEPLGRHSSFGFCLRDYEQVPVFHQVGLSSALAMRRGEPIPVAGINRPRGNNEAVVYTPHFGRTTLTDGSGVEFVVRNGKVKDIRRKAGSSPIPADGFVLSAASPEPAEGILESLRMGMRVSLEHRLVSLRTNQKLSVEDCGYSSAGPTLILAGERQDEYWGESEKFGGGFTNNRHPRTAVGLRDDHILILLVADGRQPDLSAGMSLPELTELFLQRGAISAYNLDGGGSSTMVAENKIVNSPSDGGHERPVSDAILVFEERRE